MEETRKNYATRLGHISSESGWEKKFGKFATGVAGRAG